MTSVVEISDLRLSFRSPRGASEVLRGMNLVIERGTIAGLVGESGCGKSLTALSILRLLPSNASLSGEVRLDGTDLLSLDERAMSVIRGRRIALIFQDPGAALNPVFTVGEQLTRVVMLHEHLSTSMARERATQLLQEVGLNEPDLLQRFPHQLSGGMQQRVMIAMGIAGSPDLLIADEPTTALDVTIQAQLLALLRKLCETRGISVLLITHDMAVVAQACDVVFVLYAGRTVESGPVQSLLAGPKHPYTQALLAALPTGPKSVGRLRAIGGNVPDPREAIVGCVFAERCPEVMEKCRQERPPAVVLGEQLVACWLYEAHR